ncbi:hypothetical protein U2I54_26735 [Bacillus pseudomycoides]|uniref:Uncharacterized protein n=1 Tax=Bacillus bingmayongensis TaxID=1150157 RepID=A0ABU5K481_9BACI|nr:hypothetical protein [Bacillus pseudomycoides]
MRKISKILVTAFVSIFAFAGFNLTSAEAASGNGQMYWSENGSYLQINDTMPIYDAPQGGNIIGKLGPQKIYNVQKALFEISTWQGYRWLHYTTRSEINNDAVNTNISSHQLDIIQNQNLYNTAWGTKTGVIGPQKQVPLVNATYLINSYAGPAWVHAWMSTSW